ncbi:putative protoheme IX farnesyltransferase mitochondrial precursor [Scheffersomyces amazonensis]|uniref:putative protoheme IX farnesyltransferase mitochondrial precursor n=1 Tax=Scheffersomyces amazonensis TaxID=1078765 RepID=UPI00315D45C4
MASRIISIPRMNTVGSFNFFFQNTKRNLLLHQNFIGNQYLALNHGKSRRVISSVTKSDSGSNPHHKSFILENVASKMLNCQEPGAKSSQKFGDASIEGHDNIPFKVVPRQPRVAATASYDIQSLPKSKAELMTLLGPYIKLTKPNLTVLVTLSSICSYALSPLSVSLHELLFLTVGTALCSGAANAINMGREPEFDRKMPRTVGRPVVRGLISPTQAYQFSALSGSVGCIMLWFGVNPIVSGLGFLNIILYSWIYTSLKRVSIINTWVGAIVGAIPPLMGWAASSSLMHPGSWCLAGLLYAWQFPHFNALSHNIAQQYKQAGYVMTAAENPRLNARVALRYSLLMFPLCFGLSYFGVTDWVFPFDSALANGWLTYLAYQFWSQQEKNYKNAKPTADGLALAGVHAKKLFWCSVWQLPAVLILAMLHKKGQWDRLFTYMGLKKSKDARLV